MYFLASRHTQPSFSISTIFYCNNNTSLLIIYTTTQCNNNFFPSEHKFASRRRRRCQYYWDKEIMNESMTRARERKKEENGNHNLNRKSGTQLIFFSISLSHFYLHRYFFQISPPSTNLFYFTDLFFLIISYTHITVLLS